MSMRDDPLAFWKGIANGSPALAEMAKIYLTIPATSTPSERAFTQGRLLLCYSDYNETESEYNNALICLRSWSKSNIF